MRILIIKTGALGDVLRTTSILRPLHSKYGDIEIFWLTKRNAYELLKNNDLISKILFFEEKEEELRYDFDLVVSLDDDESLCRLASATRHKELIGTFFDKEKNRCGYTKKGEDWFSMGLLRPSEIGGIEKANELKKKNKKTVQKFLLEMLDLEEKDNEIILKIDKKDKDFAKEFAEKNGLEGNTVVGLNTGSGGRWELKRMEIESTVELANRLNKKGMKVVLLGGPSEKDRNEEIKEKVDFDIIDAGTNNSLLRFAALVDLCDMVITSDSLCLHIALSMDTKVIAFFGPTSSAEIEMYGKGRKIVPKMGCVCCYKKVCDKKPCCTEMIDIDEILGAVDELR